MNFEELKPLISAYIDGETSLEETRLVEAALDSSEEARQYYTQLKQISSDLHTWQNENLSSDLELKIQREVLKKEGRTMERKKLLPVGATVAVAVLIMVSAPIVMQNYTKRGVQGRLKHATDDIGEQFSHSESKGSVAVEQDKVVLQDAMLAQ